MKKEIIKNKCLECGKIFEYGLEECPECGSKEYTELEEKLKTKQ